MNYFRWYAGARACFLKEDVATAARRAELNLSGHHPLAGRNQIDDEAVEPLDEISVSVEQTERVVQVRRDSGVRVVLQVILGDGSQSMTAYSVGDGTFDVPPFLSVDLAVLGEHVEWIHWTTCCHNLVESQFKV